MRCSPGGHRRCGASSCSTTTRPQPSRTSAAPSTGCHWPSSWPRPECGRCRCAHRASARRPVLAAPRPQQPAARRRRALAGAIAWSYELLFPDDQRGLWALSCFAGSASLEATEHVLAALEVPVASVLDTITRLVDRSPAQRGQHRRRAVRYRLLDSIRVYAGDRLRESGHSRRSRSRPRPLVRPEAAVVRRSTCGASASRSAWRSHEPNGPTSTGRWPGAPPTNPASASDRERVRLDLGRPR